MLRVKVTDVHVWGDENLKGADITLMMVGAPPHPPEDLMNEEGDFALLTPEEAQGWLDAKESNRTWSEVAQHICEVVGVQALVHVEEAWKRVEGERDDAILNLRGVVQGGSAEWNLAEMFLRSLDRKEAHDEDRP
jgi:hypothetical protein